MTPPAGRKLPVSELLRLKDRNDHAVQQLTDVELHRLARHDDEQATSELRTRSVSDEQPWTPTRRVTSDEQPWWAR